MDEYGGRADQLGYGCITTSYALGEVKGDSDVGGLVGAVWDDTCKVTNSYWTKEMSKQTEGVAGLAKTVSALTKQATYTSWDFTNTWAIEEGTSLAYLQGRAVPNKVQSIASSYPIMGGVGTQENPYIITKAEQLQRVKQDLTAYYKLGSDVDLSSISNWEPIGTEEEPFTGNFDGAGYTIKNMKISSKNNFQGLFGHTYKATIQNVKLENYQISATGTYIGGLTGYANTTTITNVQAIGNNKIQYGSASICVGGLVGEMCNEVGTKYITKCYTEGSIYWSGTSTRYGENIGGIVGCLYGGDASSRSVYLQNSYSNMQVSGSSAIGGLIGSASDYTRVQYCYARGRIYRSRLSWRINWME